MITRLNSKKPRVAAPIRSMSEPNMNSAPNAPNAQNAVEPVQVQHVSQPQTITVQLPAPLPSSYDGRMMLLGDDDCIVEHVQTKVQIPSPLIIDDLVEDFRFTKQSVKQCIANIRSITGGCVDAAIHQSICKMKLEALKNEFVTTMNTNLAHMIQTGAIVQDNADFLEIVLKYVKLSALKAFKKYRSLFTKDDVMKLCCSAILKPYFGNNEHLAMNGWTIIE